jgi:thiamine biosynthesis lipoprotein
MSGYSFYHSAWYAMGTRWELKMYSPQPETYLQSVSEALLEEVERLEEMLSFYRDSSDLTDLNARAAWEDVPVDPRFFTFLQQAAELHRATGGAFDPTIGPLLRCWGFVGSSGAMPTARALEEARAVVGMQHVHLDAGNYTVHYDREGVLLEFGAIGKGYAIERAVELLREYEIESALLHGGTSTIYGLGSPPEEDAWNIAIQRPYAPEAESLATIPLHNRALSVSAPHGKWFEQNGRRYGHVLDPHTGYPAAGSVLAAVVTESATESDALSTALLTLGEAGIPLLRAYRPDAFFLLATHEESGELHLIQEGEVPGTTGGRSQ